MGDKGAKGLGVGGNSKEVGRLWHVVGVEGAMEEGVRGPRERAAVHGIRPRDNWVEFLFMRAYKALADVGVGWV